MTDKTLLSSIKSISQYSQKISIHTADGTKVDEIPELQLCFLESYQEQKLNSEQQIKQFTLSDWYKGKKASFFCEVLNALPFPNLSGKHIVWFFSLCDDYAMRKEITNWFLGYLVKLDKDEINWKMFDELMKLYAQFKISETSATHTLFKHIYELLLQKGLNDPIKTIGEIPFRCFTYAIGRKLVCESLCVGFCTDETQLFKTIINKIIELNCENDTHKLSQEVVYALLKQLKWFNIDKTIVDEQWEILTEIYPHILKPKQCVEQMNLRIKLVGENSKNSFEYKEGTLTKFMRPETSYKIVPSNRVKSTYLYSNHYTTTKVPVSIRFQYTLIEPKQRKGIYSDHPKNSPWRFTLYLADSTFVATHGQVIVKFILKRIVGTKITQEIIKTWTFNDNSICEIKFDGETKFDGVELVFKKIYFKNNTP